MSSQPRLSEHFDPNSMVHVGGDRYAFPSRVCARCLLKHPISGVGNPNFFYAITLGHAVTGAWIGCGLVGAVLEWDYRRKHKLKLT
jgi:hypothetical protein